MDRKSIIILVLSVLVIFSWPIVTTKIWPPKPIPGYKATNNVALATNNQALATNQPSISANTNAGAAVTPPANAGTPEQTLVVTSDQARYTFTSRGGGIKQIELLNYPETVDCHKKSTETNLATLNRSAMLPVLGLGGSPALQGDDIYQLEKTANGVIARKQLPDGLVVEKEFEAQSNFLMNATVRLRNTGNQNIAIPSQEIAAGTATPMGPLDDGHLVGVRWYNGTGDEGLDTTWFANKTLGCIPGTPRELYSAGANNVRWVAAQNQFFALALMPVDPAAQIVARKISLPAPSREIIASTPKVNLNPMGLQAAVVYGATNLPPNQVVERKFAIFSGPKENRTLERLALQYKNDIDRIMGYTGFFGFFAKALLWSMNGIHSLVPSYAFAIIAITVIIKSLFWPLTAASTRSMKRMQELQPQMKALQEKYKADPVKMNKKLMEFMKENKVSPLGGCLPMVLQVPVFFGFYRMIQSAIELRGAPFLWACDLSRPDTIFVLPGLNFPVNPLPLIMGATMLWQARLTPPSPGMDPAQQKIMRYMPLMFLFILYNFSAGLTLYWTVQNLLTIAQMKLTKAKSTKAPAGPAPGMPPKKRNG
ncbi:MAG: Membrane protein insertase YidC [Verrucomicrobiales bacterium]|nr:Membrane protein insertase YidC [Verrucomicrobiales bacterium]